MNRATQDPATPRDEISSTAARVLADKHGPFDSRAKVREFSSILKDHGILPLYRFVQDEQKPTDEVIADALEAVFGSFVIDAQKLAGFVLRSDTQKGANTRKRQPRA